ncbi:MAG: TIGR02449 family protein [Gammaproteobacteria bacterium]
MAADKPGQVGELELKKLEAGIDEMIRSCDRLKEENRALRKHQATLMNERASLIERNQQAHSRVETIIRRLKVFEQET